MRYQPSYDGLRGFAIIAVVIFHLAPIQAPGGWLGVDVFFVLSGFLITSVLRTEYEAYGSIDFRKFYWFRILRLSPAFLCMLCFVLLVAFNSKAHGEEHIKSIVAALFYMTNWNVAFDWWSAGILAHTWSLSVEEQFYIIWPLLFVVLPARNMRSCLLGLIIMVSLWRWYLQTHGASSDRISRGFDTHCDALLIGCLIGLGIAPRLERVCARFVFLPLTALSYLVFFPDGPATVLLPLVALSAAWIIVAINCEGWTRNFFSFPFLVYTGRISYGWYLWHFPIWRVLDTRFHDAIGWHGFARDAGIFFFTYGIAAVSYHYLEQPVLKLKKAYRDARVAVTSKPLSI